MILRFLILAVSLHDGSVELSWTFGHQYRAGLTLYVQQLKWAIPSIQCRSVHQNCSTERSLMYVLHNWTTPGIRSSSSAYLSEMF